MPISRRDMITGRTNGSKPAIAGTSSPGVYDKRRETDPPRPIAPFYKFLDARLRVPTS